MQPQSVDGGTRWKGPRTLSGPEKWGTPPSSLCTVTWERNKHLSYLTHSLLQQILLLSNVWRKMPWPIRAVPSPGLSWGPPALDPDQLPCKFPLVKASNSHVYQALIQPLTLNNPVLWHNKCGDHQAGSPTMFYTPLWSSPLNSMVGVLFSVLWLDSLD